LVDAAFAKVADVVEAKVAKAVKNIQSGNVDFEEIFQWFKKRQAKGRPFSR